MSSSIPSTLFLVTAAGCAAIACSAAGAHDTNEAMSTTAAALDDNGDAGNTREWEPPSPTINAVTGPIAVNDDAMMLNIGQLEATKLTISATWSPQPGGTGPVATGLLAFRASSSPLLVGYVLAIDSHGFPSLLVNQLSRGGQLTSTVLAGGADAGAALTMVGGAYALQLVALGDKFTVTDSNAGGRQVLSFVDGNMGTYWIPSNDPDGWAYTKAPAVWVGSQSGAGTWQLTARQQGNGTNPPLGAAALVLPDTDQDNSSELIPGVPDILVNHFDISQPGSCEIDFDLSSMIALNKGDGLGHVTIHREDLTGQDESGASDYSVKIFQDRLEIDKQYLGHGETLATQSLMQLFPNGIVEGMQIPLQIAAYDHDGAVTINVNLTDMNETLDGGGTDLTPQTNAEQVFPNGQAVVGGKTFPQDATYAHLVAHIMSYTDTGGDEWPTFPTGVRFGLYTASNKFNCWDALALIDH